MSLKKLIFFINFLVLPTVLSAENSTRFSTHYHSSLSEEITNDYIEYTENDTHDWQFGEEQEAVSPPEKLQWMCKDWKSDKNNPLISPEKPEWMMADPTVLTPTESPDKRWHLFANSLTGIHQFVSEDGIKWKKLKKLLNLGGFRPYIYKEKGVYHIFYEFFKNLLHSEVRRISSTDLNTWTTPITVITPSLEWEKGFQQTNSNPFVIKKDGLYWLYYSANSVFLFDCFYFEPKYIGLAYSENLEGPYQKEEEPILTPTKSENIFSMGRGSIKVFHRKISDYYIALHNGIYKDRENRSRSSISLLFSFDAKNWQSLCKKPIIKPTRGWKKAFAYAFDMKEYDGKLWIYFNGRDGWAIGKEQIGLVTHLLPR